MKKILLLSSFLLSVCLHAQENQQTAKSFLKKSKQNYNKLQLNEALSNYQEGIKFLDNNNKSKYYLLGFNIHYKLKQYTKAKEIGDKYLKETNNSSKKGIDFFNFLDAYATTNNLLIQQQKQQNNQLNLALKKLSQKHKIDSVKYVWLNKVKAMTLDIDELFAFNKNGIAAYKKGEYYGAIDDTGNILVQATQFKSFKNFDGHFIFLNKEKNPTKVYCFNSFTQKGIELPEVFEFSKNSTSYNAVMLPRYNGKLIVYPNNTNSVFSFNFKTKAIEKTNYTKNTLDKIKKKGTIERYDISDKKLKVKGEWYTIGGYLGDNVYVLFNENTTELYGYLLGGLGKVLNKNEYPFIGPSCKNKMEVLKNNSSFWIDTLGDKVKEPFNESGVYAGNTKVIKVGKSKLQFFQYQGKKKILVHKNNTLEDFVSFYKKNVHK